MCRSAELTLKPLGSSPYENDKSLDSYTENTYSSQVTITNRVFYKPFLKLFYFKQISRYWGINHAPLGGEKDTTNTQVSLY